MIRDAEERDFAEIAEIYNHYIRNTLVTFEECVIDTREVSTRIGKVKSQGLWWLVAEEREQVSGYAYATNWHQRSAYRNTVELSVYLDPSCVGKGHGTTLYEELFSRLKAKGLHIAIGGIALPNPSSIKLHEKFGMEKVAHFREVGYKSGQWVDVGYWQVQIDA